MTNAEARARRIAAGRCRDCNLPRIVDQTRCELCRVKHNERMAARRRKLGKAVRQPKPKAPKPTTPCARCGAPAKRTRLCQRCASHFVGLRRVGADPVWGDWGELP